MGKADADPREGRLMTSARSQNVLATVLLLSFVLLLCPAFSVAQVVNGSFESDGQPSLSGWRFTCGGGVSSPEAPPGGGTWSLKVAPGNLQGCFPSTASQTVSTVQSGEVWRLTAWVRQDTATFTVASLYWQIVPSGGTSGTLPADTTTARGWTQLTVVDTLFLAPGDSAVIVLDAGRTSGPEFEGSGYLFDLVSAEKMGGTPVSSDDPPLPEETALRLSQNFPNPFDGTTTIPFTLSRPGYVQMEVYDVLGRRVKTLLAGYLPGGAHRAVWRSAGLPRGTYFGRLQTDQEVRVVKMALLR